MYTDAEIRSVESPADASAASPVLAVDLDGTLIKTDLLLESVMALLRQAPWWAICLPCWMLRGPAYLKEQVARRVTLDVEVLPYRSELLDYLKMQDGEGRKIVLATAANLRVARAVADHLGLFSEVIASSAHLNLSGNAKRDLLVSKFGDRGFDYIGDGKEDVAVWASARRAIAVNPARALRPAIRQLGNASEAFADKPKRLTDWIKVLRPHHWAKNLLVFAPLLAAHQLNDPALLGKLLLAFAAFGCMASSGYLVNDLLDLPADRHHPNKRFRAFASGALPLSYALWMIPALFSLGFLIAIFISGMFLAAACGYLALSLMYSMWIKTRAVLDVVFLAGLYTMRVLGGSAAADIWPSEWLLAFSTFLFFSMALVKRYGELAVMKRLDGERAKARGYELTDAELIASMGIASGYLAVLVLALYINSDAAQALYARYELMWFLCPLLLYWISNVWLIAHRGRMPDDPVTFAIRDRNSFVVILLMLIISVMAL